MNELKTKMIRKAEKLHKKIYPCAQKTQLEDCFTKGKDCIFLWYNTEDNSTHVISEMYGKDR